MPMASSKLCGWCAVTCCGRGRACDGLAGGVVVVGCVVMVGVGGCGMVFL